MQSVTPSIRTQPTPAISQPRGVEDAAPYGHQRNAGVSIVVNSCINAASLRPPLGFPERGAVAALCAVTEGLVQGGCGVPALSVNRRKDGLGDGEARAIGAVRRATAAHRGRCALRREGGTFTHCKHVIRSPTEGASRTPPPTVVAKGKFQRSHKVGGC